MVGEVVVGLCWGSGNCGGGSGVGVVGLDGFGGDGWCGGSRGVCVGWRGWWWWGRWWLVRIWWGGVDSGGGGVVVLLGVELGCVWCGGDGSAVGGGGGGVGADGGVDINNADIL